MYRFGQRRHQQKKEQGNDSQQLEGKSSSLNAVLNCYGMDEKGGNGG